MSEAHDNAHENHDHTQTYMAIWGVLFVLTIAEVAAAVYMHGAAMVLSLVGMASVKALLVARYYMHLSFEPAKLSVIAAAPVLFLAIFAVFATIEARDMPVVSIHTEAGNAEVARLLEEKKSGGAAAPAGEIPAAAESAPAAEQVPAASEPSAAPAEAAPEGH